MNQGNPHPRDRHGRKACAIRARGRDASATPAVPRLRVGLRLLAVPRLRIGLRLLAVPRLRSGLLLLTALAGCQSHPQVNAHIDTVNAEYRQLEDYVYSLEDENARLQLQLDALAAGRAAAPADAAPGTSRGGLFRSRPERLPRGGTSPAAPAEAPEIEMPGSSMPSSPALPPERIRPAGNETPITAAEDLTAAEEPAANPTTKSPPKPPAKPTDTKITHVTLSPLFTGGADFDGHPGDEGLCIVLEPRNAGEELVAEAGPISIVVLDPARDGDAARVARWDFDLSSARQKLANSGAASGIKLELPWPATPPEANKLHLFVRYETADGRKLQTDREIFLTPPGQISNRWTPRTVQRQRPAAVAQASAVEVTNIAGGSNSDSRGHAAQVPSHPDDTKPNASPPPASLSGDESAPRTARPTWSPHR